MEKGEIRQVIKWNYIVRKFDSADEVLNFAIIREIDANIFYLRLAGMVKDAGLIKVLKNLAAVELEHSKKLEAVKSGKSGLDDVDVKKLEIFDYADDIAAEAVTDYIDLLVIGMKKEETSRKLYTDLAAITEGGELKDIFLRLAQQEAKHRQRFETEHEHLTSQDR